MSTESRSAGCATASCAEQPLTYQPNVDIADLGTELMIVADIPGARADGIDVTFDDGVLAVHASVPPRDLAGRAVRHEYGIGDYRRSFRLGDGFDPGRISADYTKGVLTVRVPRVAAVLPRKIEVRSS
jgi:HSP20 family protein